MGKPTGPEGPWEPVYDDPIFLAKLDQFLAAFATRYDGKPWLRYLDIGSIGDWGEGHAWGGSRKECGYKARKAHVDLHLKHFKRTQLVASDDLVYALPDASRRHELHQHLLARGISYRDDSILVNGYLEGVSGTFTVRSPQFFADVFLNTPTVFELEHYGHVKRLGNWDGREGSLVAKFGAGKKGPDYFRGALELLHATYIGYHGYAHQWLAENREFTGEMLNRCGYWLFPAELKLPAEAARGETLELQVTWVNLGVAPAYQNYAVMLTLRPRAGGNVWSASLPGARPRDWLPGRETAETYCVPLPTSLAGGDHVVALRLANASGRTVELGFKADRRQPDGSYVMGGIRLR
jgi:hypothetical protein